ncbi:hypothetical protein CLOM_g9010 [Closterium sp. NIES-68]|nr:hypothetical protein CLOM_g9010 [Closterium sp. NIES-68]
MDLTGLRHLDVSHVADYRSGVVPQDLSRLAQLQHFDAMGNGLVGALPDYWSSLNHLTFLSFSRNKIEGSIPSTFSALTTLCTLALVQNSMDGTIPPVFSTALSSLDLRGNHFSGSIPAFLGDLAGLTVLELAANNFTGAIPKSFTKLSGVLYLALTDNQLTSGLDVISKMSWLGYVELSNNKISGAFPDLSTLPSLSGLGFRGNNFQGTFPSVLLKLTNLVSLDLGQNGFYGSIPKDVSKMSYLDFLSLDNNNFHEEIPSGLLTLPALAWLDMQHNRLTGQLPSTLSNVLLGVLYLGENDLKGPLPDFSKWNTSLTTLDLGDNSFTGSIPESIRTLTSLDVLLLRNNQLSGTFPSALLSLPNLGVLDLASNNLSGGLPSDLGTLSNLFELSVYDNQLSGKLPQSICNLTQLHTMFLRNNNFYGAFPACLFEHCLHRIDISNNSFYGPINSNFRSMIPDGGALLNIAANYFYGDPMLYADGCQFCPSGMIEPDALDWVGTSVDRRGRCGGGVSAKFRSGANMQGQASLRLNCFTLSTQLECTANETQRSSDACLAFCSMSRELGPCDGHGECVPPQAGAAGAGFTCECDDGYVTANGTLGSTCARPSPPPTTALSTGAVVGIAVGSAAAFALLLALIVALLWPRQRRKWGDLDVCQEFSMAEILRATDHWSSDNVLGKGGFATVYKGVSEKGDLWAVKRNQLMSNDFEKEIVTPLSLQQRVQLAVGAAEGVAYLHSFATPIVHRDLKPGNILVGEHFQAKIADFGLLKQLSHAGEEDDRTRIAGTPGYVDPDYNRSQVVSEKSDVYSFGVVLLELLTAQRTRVKGTDLHICEWATSKVQAYEFGLLKDVALDAPEDAVVEFADIALDCVKVPGSRRPLMKDVARRLHALLAKYCGDGITEAGPSMPTGESMEATLEVVGTRLEGVSCQRTNVEGRLLDS